MNRIAKLRELRGLSQAALAKKVRTSQPQIQRLENGERRLTEEWMKRIAAVLDVEPADLLAAATRAEFRDEIEPYLPEASDDLAKPLKSKGLRYFKVTSPSVERAGIPRGKVVLVDQSAAAIAAVTAGDVALVELRFEEGGPVRVLRQYLAPGLLTTNRSGRNTSFSLEGEEFSAKIAGIVIREP